MPGRRLGIQTHMGMAVARPSAVPGVTFLSPTAGQSVTGLVTVRGTARTSLSSATISVDGDTTRPCLVRGNTWRVSLNTNAYSSGSHTITVSVTDTGASVATGSVTVTFSAGQTITPGIQLFKLGDTGYFNTTNKNKFSLFITGQDTGGATVGTASADAATQPTRTLLWSHAVNMYQNEGDGENVSWANCVANNWVLHKPDNSGLLEYSVGSGNYMLNIGNTAYQAAVISQWLNVIFPRFPQADGVLVDNIFDTHWAGPSLEYSTNAAYRTAMLSFVTAFGTAMQDAGYYFGGNVVALDSSARQIFNGDEFLWWMPQLAPYMNGIAMENYMCWSGTTNSRVIGGGVDQAWTEWQRVLPAVEALGNDYIAWAVGTDMTETMHMTYRKASFLLDWEYRSGSAFSWSAGSGNYASTTDVWNAAYTLDVGAPSGAKTQPQTGLFRRQFANALVLVNANSSGSLTQDGHTLASGEAFIG